MQAEILRAYGFKPWDITATVRPPLRIRFWRAVTLAKRHGKVIDWRSYEAAEAEMHAATEAYLAEAPGRIQETSDRFNEALADVLPGGMRFEWGQVGDDLAAWWRAQVEERLLAAVRVEAGEPVITIRKPNRDTADRDRMVAMCDVISENSVQMRAAIEAEALVAWLRAEILARKAAAVIISDGGFAPEHWDTEPPGTVNPEIMPKADAITAVLGVDPHDEAFPRHDYWTPLFAWERENCEAERERVREADMPVALVNNGRREADHIRRSDPRDAVARCEAELAVLDELEAARKRMASEQADYGAWVRGQAPGERPRFDGPDRSLIPGLERAVRLIGSGYQHRPGYLEEWRP